MASQTIFVTGATGNQGGAATRHLLNKGFRVKALVRNQSIAKLARHENLEIVQGNLDDVSSYSKHLAHTDGIFINLIFSKGVKKEIKQGIEIIDAAKENGIKHVVYSSVIGSDLHTGIPHWESKFQIENHLRSSGLNFTILRPASLYENLLFPAVRKRIPKGKLVLPTRKDKVQQFISSDDIGRIPAMIFSDATAYTGQTLTLAAEQMDGEKLANTFSKILAKEVKFQQLPPLLVRIFMGGDLAKMFRWINNNDALFQKDLEGFKNKFGPMLSIEDWIRVKFMEK